MLEQLVQQAIEAMKSIEGSVDEMYAIQARLLKKNFDQLVKAGFTEEQAALIVAHEGTGVGKK